VLSAKNQWKWDSLQDLAFRELKSLLSSSEVLALYNFLLNTVVSSDASAYRQGAFLQQQQNDGHLHPVTYGALSETEQQYAQIEKETLVVTWACDNFKTILLV